MSTSLPPNLRNQSSSTGGEGVVNTVEQFTRIIAVVLGTSAYVTTALVGVPNGTLAIFVAMAAFILATLLLVGLVVASA